MATAKKSTGFKLALAAGGLTAAYLLYKYSRGGFATAPAPEARPQASPAAPKTVLKRNWIPAAWPLRRGMKGDLVAKLQLELNKAGANVKPDGQFGPATEAALLKLGLPAVLTQETLLAAQKGQMKQIPFAAAAPLVPSRPGFLPTTFSR